MQPIGVDNQPYYGNDPVSVGHINDQLQLTLPQLSSPSFETAGSLYAPVRHTVGSLPINRSRLPALLPKPTPRVEDGCASRTQVISITDVAPTRREKRRRSPSPMQQDKVAQDFGIPASFLCTFPVVARPGPTPDKSLPGAKRVKRAKKEFVQCIRCWRDKKKVGRDNLFILLGTPNAYLTTNSAPGGSRASDAEAFSLARHRSVRSTGSRQLCGRSVTHQSPTSYTWILCLMVGPCNCPTGCQV